MIKLTNDTIDKKDIDNLIDWLKTYPHLTKGNLTVEFEKQFSKWLGVKYSVYVNSGSSANLLMVYALTQLKLKNKKIVVPAVSWATTIAPAIQFGFEPIICDVDMDTLGVDLYSLEKIFDEHHPSALLLVHALGFPNKMKEIQTLCKEHNVVLLEDSCETLGSVYSNKKTGTFGLMSSFSLYFGHHASTIEGGLICTNDKNIYDILVMLRSHGWSRDLDLEKQKELKSKYNVDDFKSLYTFFIEGFNVRSTDLQAFIGLGQLKKLDDMIEKRRKNFDLYQKLIKNDYWKINPVGELISNFNYPIIHPKRNEIVKSLIENEIETRPLICGSMSLQPFVKNKNIISNSPNADNIVDKFGLYVPNNHSLKKKEIEKICDVINEVI